MQTIKVKCPTCEKTIAWSSDNIYRPFCCERCRLIDLGNWASENYSIPTEEKKEPFNEPFDQKE